MRNVTAVDKAKADAQSQLFAQQMTAALQNQNAGVAAGTGLGSLGSQGITSALNTGSAQMNAPFTPLGNYANLVNAVNVPGTVSQQNQMSPLSMIGALSNVPSAAGNLLSSLGITGASFGGLGNSIMNSLNLGKSTPSITDAVSTSPDMSRTMPVQTTDPNAAGYFDPALNQQYPQGSM